MSAFFEFLGKIFGFLISQPKVQKRVPTQREMEQQDREHEEALRKKFGKGDDDG